MNDVLFLIDVQRNMLLPPAPVPGADEVSLAIVTVLDRARAAGALVVHIRNNGSDDDPDKPGTPGWELIHEVRPHERLVDKHACDAFEGTDLDELLRASDAIVVVGMQSEWCVRETTLAALGRGHSVTLVRGAHATYDDGVAERVEAELAEAGAKVAGPDDVEFG